MADQEKNEKHVPDIPVESPRGQFRDYPTPENKSILPSFEWPGENPPAED